MCEVKDFLSSHPGISIHWVEKQCGIPLGTIKLNSTRSIPNKYKEPIKELLSTYGWVDVPKLGTNELPVPISGFPTQTYFIENNVLKYREEEGLNLLKRANLKDGTKLIIIS